MVVNCVAQDNFSKLRRGVSHSNLIRALRDRHAVEGAYVQASSCVQPNRRVSLAHLRSQNRKTAKTKENVGRRMYVYVHLRWTMEGPLSSYSSFLIHISSKVLSEDRIEPPIHTEYLRSGGAMILIVIESGASAFTSFCTRSGMPVYMVVPPLITMLPYRSLRMSTSHFMIELNVSLCTPSCSRPRNCGWNSDSGARKRSAPMVITCPSGSS